MSFNEIKKWFENDKLSDDELVSRLNSKAIGIQFKLHQHSLFLKAPWRGSDGETILHLAIANKRLAVLQTLKIMPPETRSTLRFELDALHSRLTDTAPSGPFIEATAMAGAGSETDMTKEAWKLDESIKKIERIFDLYSSLYFERFLNASCLGETVLDQSLNSPPVRQDARAIILIQSWGGLRYEELNQSCIAAAASEDERRNCQEFLICATDSKGKVQKNLLTTLYGIEDEDVENSETGRPFSLARPSKEIKLTNERAIKLIKENQFQIERAAAELNPFDETIVDRNPKNKLDVFRINREGIFRINIETAESVPVIFTPKDFQLILMPKEETIEAIPPQKAVNIISTFLIGNLYWTWENFKKAEFFKVLFDLDWFDHFCAAMVESLPTPKGIHFLNRSLTSLHSAMNDLLALKEIFTAKLVLDSDALPREAVIWAKRPKESGEPIAVERRESMDLK